MTSAKCNLVIPRSSTPSVPPDGCYYAVWEWYRVVFVHEGYEYHLIVAEGFRDHPTRCKVEVEDGKITVYSLTELP